MSALRSRTGSLTGQRLGDASVELADDFCYRDPVDQSEAAHQGIRVVLDDGCRIVYRLSGTGTTGATLRVYLEKHERDPARLSLDPSTVLASLGNVAAELGHIRAITGLVAPSMVV
jgi:phosphoglucomutase